MTRASNLAGFTTSITSTTDLSVGIVTARTIVAVSATFTGNVSIAGTLTYDDVTNVDSIGLITARTGIQVLAGGIDAVGVITASSDIKIGTKSVATTGKAIAMAMVFS